MCAGDGGLRLVDFGATPTSAFGKTAAASFGQKSTSALMNVCSWMDKGSSPEPPPGSEEETRWLRRQNSRLSSRLEQHESKGSDNLSRRTRDEASLVMRHEEQLRRVVAQYEQKLAAQSDIRPRSLGSSAKLGPVVDDDARRHLEAVRRQAEDAEMEREAAAAQAREAEAQASKYKRKMQKLKARAAEDARSTRDRLRCVTSAGLTRGAMSSVRLTFVLWRQAAQRARDEAATLARAQLHVLEIQTVHSAASRWPGARTVDARVVAVVAARPLLLLMASFRAWASAVSEVRYQMELRVQLDEASMQSMSALANLRADVRVLRIRVRKAATQAADARALGSLAAPMATWVRAVCKSKQDREAEASAAAAAAAAADLAAIEAPLTPEPEAEPGEPKEGLSGDAASAVFRISASSAAVSGGQRRLSLLAMLHAWGAMCLEKRREADLRVQIDDASMQSMNAIAMMRADVRTLRHRGLRAAHRAAASRVRLALTSALGAWARVVLGSRPRGGKGDTVLNSGVAAKQVKKELEDVRAQHAQQVVELQKEASLAQQAAARLARNSMQDASRIAVFVDRQVLLMAIEQASGVLSALFKAWASSSIAERNVAALHRAQQALEELKAKHTVELECVRGESSASLRNAWDAANEAKRQLAALDRRRENWEAEREVLASRGGLRPSTSERRPGSSCGSGFPRPTTALGVEQVLQAHEVEATSAEAAAARSADAAAAAAGMPATAPEVLLLDGGPPRDPEGRSRHRWAIDALLTQQEWQMQTALFEVWRHVASSAKAGRGHAALMAQERLLTQDARQGRKGLFIAALTQQAKYWQSEAMTKWRIFTLESRLDRAQNAQAAALAARREGTPDAQVRRISRPPSAGSRSRPSGPPTPAGGAGATTPRAAAQHMARR